MWSYLGRRIIQAIFTLVIITVVCFTLTRLSADPMAQYVNRPGLTAEDKERIRKQLGLDQPLPVQYVRWLGLALQGELGTSFFSKQPVSDLIRQRLPMTLILMLSAEVITVTISLFFGVISAVKQYSLTDNIITIASFIGYSMPIFFVALGLMLIFSVQFEVVGRASDGMRLVEEALRLEPALVLTDVSLPRLGGLTAARLLRRELPGARVVFLAAQEDPQVAAEAFRCGARGYVLRSASPRELGQALRAVLKGDRWLSPALAGGNPDALPDEAWVPGPLVGLSPRKREVIRLLAEGNSTKQAADALGVKPRTIAHHKYQAMKALAVKSSAQLVRFAVESRLLAAAGN